MATTTQTEEDEITVAWIPTIPRMKYHGAPLHFMSSPCISQEDYEQKVWTHGLATVNSGDETIEVMCPSLSNGEGHLFQVKRSILSRSSAFIDFFRSPHYLGGCGMRITFMMDPASCFQIACSYLSDGPDLYTKHRLKLFINKSYQTINRFVVLARLHLLATKLALPVLANMAYEILVDTDSLVDPLCCITVARYIFTKNAGFDKLLKDWCFKQIGYCFAGLKQTREWNDALDTLEPELSERWIKFMDTYMAVAMTLREMVNQYELENTIRALSFDRREHTPSVFGGDDLTFEEFINKIKDEETPTYEEEWEDTSASSRAAETHTPSLTAPSSSSTSTSTSRSTKSSKSTAASDDLSLRTEMPTQTTPNTLTPPETAKARQVMGLDGDIGSLGRQGELEARRTSGMLLRLLE